MLWHNPSVLLTQASSQNCGFPSGVSAKCRFARAQGRLYCGNYYFKNNYSAQGEFSSPLTRGRLVPRWSAPQRLTLTLGMLRSLRGTRTTGGCCAMKSAARLNLSRKRDLPLSASGIPSAEQRALPSRTGGEWRHFCNRGPLKMPPEELSFKSHEKCRARPARHFCELVLCPTQNSKEVIFTEHCHCHKRDG